MSFALDMYDKAKHHPAMEGFCCVLEGHPAKLPFPLSVPYICFGTEKIDSQYLLGDDEGVIETEVMTVKITVPDGFNGDYCRECAKCVTLALADLDDEKRIISISAGECSFDEHSYGYSLKLKFGLRAVRRIRG